MVQKGFQMMHLLEGHGRMIIVRTDDLTPVERAEVSELFDLVQRIQSLGELPLVAAVVTGVMTFIMTACIAAFATDATFRTGIIATTVITAIASAIAYGIANGHVRARTPEAYERILVLMRRNERCHIAAEEIRQSGAWYAKMLPPTSALESPAAG